MMIVSLAEASNHLRRDELDGDASDLTLKIQAASEVVLDYIRNGLGDFKDSNGDLTPQDSNGDWIAPYTVKAAVLLMLGYLYLNRDNDATKEFEGDNLPRPVAALLRTFRTPVLVR